MKNIEKIIYTGILVSLIGSSHTYASNKISNNNTINTNQLIYIKDRKVDINKMFTIETKEFNEESEFFKADIKYPYLKIKQQSTNEENSYRKTIEKLNKKISDNVLNFKNEIKQYSQSYKEEYEKEPDKDKYNKYQYEAYTNYKVPYNKNNIISIPVILYQFTGGAHGMSEMKTYNYNLLTDEEIALKDLFKEDSDYKERINQYIREKIEKEKSNYFAGEDGFKGISDNQNYYIEDDGIVVYFSLYEIAPYSTGMPEFKITWDKIADILKIKL